MMQPLATVLGHELKWVQPSAFKMEYELRAGAALVATLRFRSSFGSFATAESSDGCWTLKRVGFWRPKVTIRACNTDTDLATFTNNTWSGGGTLTLPDGRTLLASTNFWSTHYEIKTPSDQPVLGYTMGGLAHLSATVEVQPTAREVAELSWLVPFGWYLAVLMYMDSSSVGSSVVVVA